MFPIDALPLEIIYEIAYKCSISEIVNLCTVFKIDLLNSQYFWKEYVRRSTNPKNDFMESLVAGQFECARGFIDSERITPSLEQNRPMRTAIEINRLDIVKFLISIPKVASNVKKYNDPLVFAAAKGRFEIVEFLSSNEELDIFRAFVKAYRKRHHKVADFLYHFRPVYLRMYKIGHFSGVVVYTHYTNLTISQYEDFVSSRNIQMPCKSRNNRCYTTYEYVDAIDKEIVKSFYS